MATTQVSRELKLIRERLDSIEEALSEEMSVDDKNMLREALDEHKQDKTIRFSPSKKHYRWKFSCPVEHKSFSTNLHQTWRIDWKKRSLSCLVHRILPVARNWKVLPTLTDLEQGIIEYSMFSPNGMKLLFSR